MKCKIVRVMSELARLVQLNYNITQHTHIAHREGLGQTIYTPMDQQTHTHTHKQRQVL